MKVLVTGGRGKTATRLTSLLQASNVPFLTTSRSGPSSPSTSDPKLHPCVRFDWLDSSTYDAPFADTGVDRVWIVAPPLVEMAPLLTAFIDKALENGVRRLVLLSGSPLDENGPAMGAAHKYIKGRHLSSGVEYCVLRPTWFMENLSESPTHPITIRAHDKIISATGEGRIPWISAEDIAAVAFQALTRPESFNTDLFILGPELLSYNDVAKIISDEVGRQITHESKSEAELVKYLTDTGMPAAYASMLAAMDIEISKGSEENLNGVVLTVTGRPPKNLVEFVKGNRTVWAKDAGVQ